MSGNTRTCRCELWQICHYAISCFCACGSWNTWHNSNPVPFLKIPFCIISLTIPVFWLFSCRGSAYFKQCRGSRSPREEPYHLCRVRMRNFPHGSVLYPSNWTIWSHFVNFMELLQIRLSCTKIRHQQYGQNIFELYSRIRTRSCFKVNPRIRICIKVVWIRISGIKIVINVFIYLVMNANHPSTDPATPNENCVILGLLTD